MTVASTPVKSPTTDEPGGVLLLVNGSIKEQVLEMGTDYLGPLAFTKLSRNTGPPLNIIVTYQVVDVDPRHASPMTYATQLYSLYIKEACHNPENLRQHHAHDLIKFIKEIQAHWE